jgi:hypothetical protein
VSADSPIKLGAVACLSADGPSVAMIIRDETILLSREEADRWGRALIREAGRAEGFVLMAAGMELCNLSKKTRDRVLNWAVFHTVGEKQ